MTLTKTPWSSVLLGAALGLTVVAALEAGTEGRVTGVITDASGTPLADVKITVTTPEITTFKLDRKSDAKGKYSVLLLDATRRYVFRFEKEGFQPLETDLKPKLGEPLRRDFQLASGAAQPAPASAAAAAGEAPAPAAAGGDPAIPIFNEGVLAHQAGDRALAREKFEEAARINPNLMQAHYGAAAIAMEEGRHADAAAGAERTLAIDPTFVRALDLRFRAYSELGDQAKTEAAADALFQADPQLGATALYNLAVALYNGGKTARAAGLLERLLAAAADHAKAHYMLGLCHVNQGNSAEAKRHLERFLELAPEDPDAATAKEMLAYL